MRKITCLAGALAVPLALTTASPASADSSSCTHHLSGPQVCIRLNGNNGWNSVTAIWTNPPKGTKSRAVTLYWNGERFNTRTAKKKGKSLSYTWSAMDTGTGTKLCVKFKGSSRMACEKTAYSGS
ncbi:hypothetical protein [Streptomyces sp. NBC_00467]|uniref:hypothetical protein n=1 Tax=Streptomyces sp. NBC_00467 TaxID=2975752 RepID=UPI002E19A20C